MKLKVNLEFKFIISLIFAIVVAVFAIQNAGSVEINFLFAKFTISQAVVILGSAVVGALITILLSVIKQIKQNTTIKQLTKERDNFKEENTVLQGKLDELTNNDKKETSERENGE